MVWLKRIDLMTGLRDGWWLTHDNVNRPLARSAGAITDIHGQKAKAWCH
jgi:hypothetical protein